MGNSRGRWLARLFLSVVGPLSAFISTPALAEPDCHDGTAPLLEVEWRALHLDPDRPRQWKLPPRAGFSGGPTEARLGLQFLRSEGKWFASFSFTFPDPKPYGIPFSFERLELAWSNFSVKSEGAVEIDWSDACQAPGRSLFPGQSWSVRVELPENLANSEALSDASLRLWGSRN